MNTEQLVKEYGIKISRLSHRMIWNNELAEEASQEVWYEVLKSLDTFKGNSSISTWIYSIAKRTILRYSQKERILKSSEIDSHFNLESIDYNGSENNEKEWVKEQCDYCLTAFCHCLTNKARMIFLFRDIAELRDSEIAQIMDLKAENIRQIASRSREKVKNFMQKDCILFNSHAKCRCRIRKHVESVGLDEEYKKLSNAARLVDIYKKFDKELPRKNYWEKII
ncbi:RNA polymerase sigma factor [Saccharicrinis aurantiacus]|uniref:RNA polymerase sigma factor n=1 Tax=Saccharicrinis aurantiacus TaxID=1849719 RepID=UPI000838D522|nr:sigma-70 family RNA polymerase sigma factor [Saccharicrinis aurantiacus]